MIDERIRDLERQVLSGDAAALDRLKAEWLRLAPPKNLVMGARPLPRGHNFWEWRADPHWVKGLSVTLVIKLENTSEENKLVQIARDDRTIALTVLPYEP